MRASASRIALLDYCAYWANDGVVWDEEKTYAAFRGTQFHAAKCAYIANAPHTLPTTDWFKRRYPHACRYIDNLKAEGYNILPEVALGWEYDKVTVLNVGTGERDYPDGVFCGTIDILAYNPDLKSLYVGDWKTGRYISRKDWEQIHTLSFMAHTWAESVGLPVLSIAATILHVHEGGVVPRMEPVDPAKERTKLVKRLMTIEGAWPQASQACDECYCPHRKHCHAYKQRNAA